MKKQYQHTLALFKQKSFGAGPRPGKGEEYPNAKVTPLRVAAKTAKKTKSRMSVRELGEKKAAAAAEEEALEASIVEAKAAEEAKAVEQNKCATAEASEDSKAADKAKAIMMARAAHEASYAVPYSRCIRSSLGRYSTRYDEIFTNI